VAKKTFIFCKEIYKEFESGTGVNKQLIEDGNELRKKIEGYEKEIEEYKNVGKENERKIEELICKMKEKEGRLLEKRTEYEMNMKGIREEHYKTCKDKQKEYESILNEYKRVNNGVLEEKLLLKEKEYEMKMREIMKNNENVKRYENENVELGVKKGILEEG